MLRYLSINFIILGSADNDFLTKYSNIDFKTFFKEIWSLHCPKNNMNLCLKLKPVTDEAAATAYCNNTKSIKGQSLFVFFEWGYTIRKRERIPWEEGR